MSSRRQRIWITRAEPAAQATAERVRAMGHEALVTPLLQVRAVADARVDLDGIAALAFTSANGVRAFADLCSDRSLQVFAVGLATAQAARSVGFKSVLSADGDVETLAEAIGPRRRELKGAVLHPGAAELAGDLVGALERQGIQGKRLTLYETEAVKLAAQDAEALVTADTVLLHSPRAAQVLATLLRAHPAPHLRALGLSKAVIRPLSRARLAARLFPPFPLEAALLNLIDRSA